MSARFEPGKLDFHMIDILLNTTFSILPVAVATLLLVKTLFEQIFSWDISRENQKTTRSTGIRIIIASMAVAQGVLLCFFATWLLFFPAYEIPDFIKILGIVLYFGFWCTIGILYRMAKAARSATAGTKANKILNNLFVITADHRISLNPKMYLSALLNQNTHKDSPDSKAGL